MTEYDRSPQRTLTDKSALKICVAGVGGAGSNVLDRITLDRTVEADLVCFHTDVRVLGHAMSPTKVQLGGELMRGVGAGGDPDLGREASLFSKEQIRQALSGHQIVFICAGLGGGTGSGAAPVVAEIAKSTGALVLVLATMPFSFEGRRRLNQAEEALELLQKRADALVVFENNRMGELILPKEGIQKAFSSADQLIAQSVRAVSAMVSTPGLVKLGLDDLVAALSASNGRCLFGFGESKGQNRGTEALKKALKSPLVDQGRLLQQTKNLLVHVVGGESLTLVEVEGVMKQLSRNVPDETQILFGLAVDQRMGDNISVTLISSLGAEQINARGTVFEVPAAEPPPMHAAASVKKASPAAPAPVVEDEPEAGEEPMELFGVSLGETPAAETGKKPAPTPEPVVETQESVINIREDADEPAAKDTAEEEKEVEAEIEEEEAPVVRIEVPAAKVSTPPASSVTSKITSEPTEETASIPVTPRPQRREEPAPASGGGRGIMAAVLGSSAPNTRTNSTRPPVDEIHEEEMLVGAGAPAATAATSREQATFRLGDEDRGGRFKDTEPSLVEGEDMDVPTWMRLRKKLRK
jgi:cell division protein FtsZ